MRLLGDWTCGFDFRLLRFWTAWLGDRLLGEGETDVDDAMTWWYDDSRFDERVPERVVQDRGSTVVWGWVGYRRSWWRMASRRRRSSVDRELRWRGCSLGILWRPWCWPYQVRCGWWVTWGRLWVRRRWRAGGRVWRLSGETRWLGTWRVSRWRVTVGRGADRRTGGVAGSWGSWNWRCRGRLLGDRVYQLI